jgi:NhaP-type Na+/H+ or K+/H+ antiporter
MYIEEKEKILFFAFRIITSLFLKSFSIPFSFIIIKIDKKKINITERKKTNRYFRVRSIRFLP